MSKPNLQNIGNAGEYYIASVLSVHGFTTTITLGRAEKYDIIAINPNGKTVKLQVKTMWYKVNSWMLDQKNEDLEEDNLFYALVRLNELKEPPEFWIFPSKLVSNFIREYHKTWLSTLGKKGQKHNDTKRRTFTIKSNRFTPEYWAEKEGRKYYQNIDLLK